MKKILIFILFIYALSSYTQVQGICQLSFIQNRLLKAVQSGYSWEVALYLNSGCSPDFIDDHNWSLLHWAAFLGHEKIVQLLVARNVDLQARDNGYRTALDWAVMKGYLNIVQLLVENGANIYEASPTTLRTPLLLAVKYYRFEIVTYLLQQGADIFDLDVGNLGVLYFISPGGRPVCEVTELRANMKRMACIVKDYLNIFLEVIPLTHYLNQVTQLDVSFEDKVAYLHLINDFLINLGDYFKKDGAFMQKVAFALFLIDDLLKNPESCIQKPIKNARSRQAVMATPTPSRTLNVMNSNTTAEIPNGVVTGSGECEIPISPLDLENIAGLSI